MRVMADRGYERASIKQIASEAGVASGIVHYHFGSKQKILVALVEELSERIRGRYEGASHYGSHREKLFALLDAHLALGEGSDPQVVAAWVAVGAEAVGQPEVREVYAQQVARTVEALRTHLAGWLVSEGKDPARSEPGAAALMAAIEGAYQLSAAAPGVLPSGYAAPSVRLLATSLVDSA